MVDSVRQEFKHNVYMSIAEQIAQLSYANRLKVGAILVKDDNIISFGYNGTPHNFENECEIDNVTKKYVLHAESNAITKCAKNTSSSDNSTLYTTHSPCFECAKLIIQSGIKAVIYREVYHSSEEAIKLLEMSNILVKRI